MNGIKTHIGGSESSKIPDTLEMPAYGWTDPACVLMLTDEQGMEAAPVYREGIGRFNSVNPFPRNPRLNMLRPPRGVCEARLH